MERALVDAITHLYSQVCCHHGTVSRPTPYTRRPGSNSLWTVYHACNMKPSTATNSEQFVSHPHAPPWPASSLFQLHGSTL
jgi:hypothetical protein